MAWSARWKVHFYGQYQRFKVNSLALKHKPTCSSDCPGLQRGITECRCESVFATKYTMNITFWYKSDLRATI